ncbi:MAG: glycosyltransferase [Patescibacteria group bacterium]|nr:glycosyltransferase [Patescibacteria group bacterium]
MNDIGLFRVTVLIATWNRKDLIGKAIESVLQQSFPSWELIVIDDGSTDGTEEVVAKYIFRDSRVKYIKIDHIGRIAVVSNRGLRLAVGDYIAILDDDDVWIDEDKLKKQVDFLDKNQLYVGCGGGMIGVDRAGNGMFRSLKPESDAEIKKRALCANPMINSATMFRRSIAEKIGFYDETLSQFADWDFWLKIGTMGKLYNFQEYFVLYLVWDKSSSFTKQKENARSALTIVKKYRKIYPNFKVAFVLAVLYRSYTFIPASVRRFLNPIFSIAKKKIFSK